MPIRDIASNFFVLPMTSFGIQFESISFPTTCWKEFKKALLFVLWIVVKLEGQAHHPLSHLRSETGYQPVQGQGAILPQSVRWTVIEADFQPQLLPLCIHAEVVDTCIHMYSHIHTYIGTHTTCLLRNITSFIMWRYFNSVFFQYNIFIIWEFHIMHPYHTPQSSQVWTPNFVTSPWKKRRKRFKFCCSYTHWYSMEHGQFFTDTYICMSCGEIIVTKVNAKVIIWFSSNLLSMSALPLIVKIYFQIYIPTVQQIIFSIAQKMKLQLNSLRHTRNSYKSVLKIVIISVLYG